MARLRQHSKERTIWGGYSVVFALVTAACAGAAHGEDKKGSPASAPNGTTLPTLGGTGGWNGPCTNLECQIHACSSGTTTISGRVFDPAGKNPLYNVAVYVPNSTPEPFSQGPSCGACNSLYTGTPIATAITDADGNFLIENAPDGENIPLVIQVGKWRRVVTLKSVGRCTNTWLPDGTLTLPKNHTEGDIPMIAISTGGWDTLECLLTRVGIDDSEFSPGATGPGHIQIFQGDTDGQVPNTSPPGPLAPAALWDSVTDLMRYDVVLLSCEGTETVDMNQSALVEYTSQGGRVFASHYHYAWFNTGPFSAQSLASWSPGTNDLGNIDAQIQTTLPNGAPFPKGQAMREWLGNVGALQNGQLPLVDTMHNANVGPANPLSTPWILANGSSPSPNAAQYFSFDTPLGAPPDQVCGRVVYSDLHVGAASHDNPNLPVPAECYRGALSPQEKALEFMLFDLSACVTPVTATPAPPLPTK